MHIWSRAAGRIAAPLARCIVGVALCLAGWGTAAAQDLSAEPLLPEPGRAVIDLGAGHSLALIGSARLIAGHSDGLLLAPHDAQLDAQSPDDNFGHFRLRVKPAWIYQSGGFFQVYKVALDAEAQTYGTALGETPSALRYDPHWQHREESDTLRLTQAYATAVGRYGALKVGLVRAHFGLGMVANAGEDGPPNSVAQSPFGYARQHDRNLRAQLSLFVFEPRRRPEGLQVPLALMAAVDRVIDDDTVQHAQGDRAWQAMGGAMVHVGDLRLMLGLLRREQQYAQGGETKIWLTAASGRYDWRAQGHHLWAEGEFAGYFGETDLTQSPILPGPFEVWATGWVGRVGYRQRVLEAVFETGAASGDSNPFDDKVRGFAFDREYRVGLLLFNEALRQHSAVAALNAADPDLKGHPARGFDQIPTGGALENTVYVNPRVALHLGEGLSLLFGYVYARSEEPVADPFHSGLVGGTPAGWRGRAQARSLGHELDLGIAFVRPMGPFEGRWSLQFAWARLGEAFAPVAGDAQSPLLAGQFAGEVRW